MNSGYSDYQAKMRVPFGVLGIRANNDVLTHIDFLPAEETELAPQNRIAAATVEQLSAYFDDPAFEFGLPLELHGTHYQRRVWELMRQIPAGRTRTYGDLAGDLASGARAIGGACGANPIPIIVPCHRVVAAGGGMGGFNNTAMGGYVPIKRWLLAHEGALPAKKT